MTLNSDVNSTGQRPAHQLCRRFIETPQQGGSAPYRVKRLTRGEHSASASRCDSCATQLCQHENIQAFANVTERGQRGRREGAEGVLCAAMSDERGLPPACPHAAAAAPPAASPKQEPALRSSLSFQSSLHSRAGFTAARSMIEASLAPTTRSSSMIARQLQQASFVYDEAPVNSDAAITPADGHIGATGCFATPPGD